MTCSTSFESILFSVAPGPEVVVTDGLGVDSDSAPFKKSLNSAFYVRTGAEGQQPAYPWGGA